MFITPSNSPSSPGSKSSTSSKSSSKPIGAIIGGVVGGIVLIALIAVGFILLRKRNQPEPATDAGTTPAVAQVPQDPAMGGGANPHHSYPYPGSPAPQYYPQQGYIWDPHSQQYYHPGSPPPQSPGNDGYYGKPQAPVEAPADVPTSPPTELA